MLDISKTTGKYRESGRWWDSNGDSGTLQGNIDVSARDDQLVFTLDGGHIMQTAQIEANTPASLQGTGGGASTSGTLYVGDDSFILEYVANVHGREERNTDVWDFSATGLKRRGLIRQDQRTIWFEASMR